MGVNWQFGKLGGRRLGWSRPATSLRITSRWPLPPGSKRGIIAVVIAISNYWMNASFLEGERGRRRDTGAGQADYQERLPRQGLVGRCGAGGRLHAPEEPFGERRCRTRAAPSLSRSRLHVPAPLGPASAGLATLAQPPAPLGVLPRDVVTAARRENFPVTGEG